MGNVSSRKSLRKKNVKHSKAEKTKRSPFNYVIDYLKSDQKLRLSNNCGNDKKCENFNRKEKKRQG